MPGLYSHTTRSTGTVLTATIYNSDHQNHIDNHIPQMMDDYSASVGQMQANTDPGEAGSESLATSLSGELERLRFAIKDVSDHIGFTKAQWYSTPTGTIPSSKLSTVAIAQGGTGATTAAAARTNLDVPSNAEAVLKAIFDAKGDILAATANDTPARLAVGANNTILLADSAQSTGLKWGTINDLTEDTAPDAAADFLLEYDTSAAVMKRVLMYRVREWIVAHEGSGQSGGDNNYDFTVPSWARTIELFMSNVDGSAASQTCIVRARTAGGGTITSGYVGTQTGSFTSFTVGSETNGSFHMVLRRINEANQPDKWLAVSYYQITAGTIANANMAVIDLTEALSGLNINLAGGGLVGGGVSVFTIRYN